MTGKTDVRERQPVHADLEKPVYRAWRQFLRQGEDWSPEEITSYQLQEVRRLLRWVYENCRGYRELYDAWGLTPEVVQSLEDLRKFPLVEKEMVRDRLDDFSVPLPGRTYITTGGSTGIPLGMYRDPEAFPKELASKAHQYARVGWKEDDRQMILRGQPINTADHMIFVPEFNELRCSSYHLVPEQMEAYRQRMLDYKPEWLRCYPSSGFIFARWLKDTGRFFPQVKGILCASENLYDFQKKLLSEVFGVRVFSHYGHYELAVLAGYCQYRDTYHVLPQYGYAELIGPAGQPVTQPGEIGEIVGTSFIMQATPFIRYRTQDYAVLKGWGCPFCSRPYQIWERVEGRLQEFIVTKTGRFISMTAINFHDDIFDHIKQFQFLQEEEGEVVFNYIPKNTLNSQIIKDMEQRLLVKLGDDVHLRMQAVPDIPLTPRGKHRFLIQKLSIEIHDYQSLE